MQACIETAPPPTVADPTWAISFARPSTFGRRTAETLHGVPRLALQTIFGNHMDRRIWDRARSKVAHAAAVPAHTVTDAEISAGMVEYLSKQAADALGEARRQATALRLTVTWAQGETHVARMHLSKPTSEAAAIADGATRLLSRFPTYAVQSVNLALSTVDAPAINL
jgi:hypothetical protein